MGTQAAADGGEFGGFASDDLEVSGLVEVKVSAVMNLLHLAFADEVCGVADPAAGEGGFE